MPLVQYLTQDFGEWIYTMHFLHSFCPHKSRHVTYLNSAFSSRGRSQTTLTRFGSFWPSTPFRLHFLWYKSLQKFDLLYHLPPSSCKRSLWTALKWIIGHTKWIFVDFLNLTLVEYCTKWIHIMRGPSIRILKWIRQQYILHMTNENRTIVFSCTFVPLYLSKLIVKKLFYENSTATLEIIWPH